MSGELKVDNVGKAYRVWRSEWLRAASWFGVPTRPKEENWVLRNVSFTIAPGEAVGVIGQNGAGKSTLLKLITGTAQPTEGVVTRTGRVAAILELGMGFNPDLTGRQNAFHSAGLMGYSQEQIQTAMPEIEAFAEVGEYFDQPVRTYSSGMQVRVAFAVATAFTPDLLIVDEALSVGDSYFQHKSFDRMRRFRQQGTSIMLVSHSLSDVKALCDRAILLDKGRVLKDGEPDEVIDFYNALIAKKENEMLSVEQRRSKSGWVTTRSGTGQARVASLELLDRETGKEVKLATVGQKLRLQLQAEVGSDLPSLVLGFMMRDKQGQIIWGSNTWHTGQVQRDVRVGERLVYHLDFTCTLGPGSYSVSPALVSTETHMVDNFEWVDNLLVFEVMNADKTTFIGSNWLDAHFSVERGHALANGAQAD
ncbi:sugar ABC transporter ATP-binding protein [Stenotrophomonas lactitubi]|jgi:lipopolysaccharide transport system ATP-binding protein|uniref:ABC transporter ATP-binding protein n=1 Tax=Stenotrophomonas TaxID=40323 RepID=UPI000C27BE06|nr:MULTISPECIES: ABC transporter ATP-binding protein [Stenotrophomonas]MBD3682825.1 ABC transporter ATP-binding protein [Stenotrophomonas sp. Br8]PJO50292.1 sugar ABC transporter ATP-binding protein [Stenotrophomonas lactitubi]